LESLIFLVTPVPGHLFGEDSPEPADVHGRIAAYSTWLNTASLPKLFIDAEPGVFITGRIRKLASSFPNQDRVVRGLHFVQEDSPDEVGGAIAGWLERICN
jgi:haloalkane dehalogenase